MKKTLLIGILYGLCFNFVSVAQSDTNTPQKVLWICDCYEDNLFFDDDYFGSVQIKMPLDADIEKIERRAGSRCGYIYMRRGGYWSEIVGRKCILQDELGFLPEGTIPITAEHTTIDSFYH